MSDTEDFRVLYFAWVREAAGTDEEAVKLTPPATGKDLKAYLLATYPMLSGRQDKLRLAINQDHADWSAQLDPADEIAVFPPVTGG